MLLVRLQYLEYIIVVNHNLSYALHREDVCLELIRIHSDDRSECWCMYFILFTHLFCFLFTLISSTLRYSVVLCSAVQ